MLAGLRTKTQHGPDRQVPSFGTHGRTEVHKMLRAKATEMRYAA
jgi:hypothetical protein